jgi:hypothetical protein
MATKKAKAKVGVKQNGTLKKASNMLKVDE